MKRRVGFFVLAAVVVTSAVQAQSSKIAFSSDRSTPSTDLDIYIMKEDGSNQTQVTSEAGEARRPSLSFNGQRTLFDDENHIYMMQSNGTALQNLTADLTYLCGNHDGGKGCEDADAGPAIGTQLPKDFRIVFTHETKSGPMDPSGPGHRVGNLYLATVDVSEGKLINVIPLTFSTTCGDPVHYQPAWCGASHIVWSREVGSLCVASDKYFWKICTMEVDDDGAVPNTTTCFVPGGEFADQYPSCNSDGTMIAFARSAGTTAAEQPHDICTMGFDRSNLNCDLLVDPGNAYDDTRPVWSPSGSVIAFASNRSTTDFPGSPEDFEIWVMNSEDGTGLAHPTDNDDPDDDPDYGPAGLGSQFP